MGGEQVNRSVELGGTTYEIRRGNPVNLAGWENPYTSLEYGFLVYDPNVKSLLRQEEEWDVWPKYAEVAKGVRSSLIDNAILNVGLAVNGAYHGDERTKVWGESMEILLSAFGNDLTGVVATMHRAGTSAADLADRKYHIKPNPKRLHAEDDKSKIAAAIEVGSLAGLSQISLKGEKLVAIDPMLATGASLKAVLMYLNEIGNLPSQFVGEHVFATQQGAEDVANLCYELGVEPKIKVVKFCTLMNDNGYLCWPEGDPTRIEMEKHIDLEGRDYQVAGDAGDMFEVYKEYKANNAPPAMVWASKY